MISHNCADNLAFKALGPRRRFAVEPTISYVVAVVVVYNELVDHKQKASGVVAELVIAAARAGFVFATTPRMLM